MAVDPFVDGVVVALTGTHVPRADPAAIRAAVERPDLALVTALGDLQDEIAKTASYVAGAVEGTWSKAYAEAMSTLASGDSADAVRNLKETAAAMAAFGHESAYQVEYMNRMIIAQVGQFLVDWAITLVLAVFNPIQALVEQTFLRTLYRAVLRSVILRVIALIAEHEALNIGLGAALDRLVRWSLSLEGQSTAHSGDFFQQAVEFGAVQGALSPVVPFAGSALSRKLGRAIGRDTGKDLARNLAYGLAHDVTPPVGNTAARAERAVDTGGHDGAVEGRPAGPGPAAAGPHFGLGADFGRDFARITGRLVDDSAFTGVDEAARTGFRTEIGELFAGGLRGLDPGAARGLGEQWADTFTAGLGTRGLGRKLDTALSGLPPEFAGLRRTLSTEVADATGTGWRRRIAFHGSFAAVEAGHQNISEGLYSLFTTGEFSTSFATGLAGAAGGRGGHALHVNAHMIGSGLREKVLGLKPVTIGGSRPAAAEDLNSPLPEALSRTPPPSLRVVGNRGTAGEDAAGAAAASPRAVNASRAVRAGTGSAGTESSTAPSGLSVGVPDRAAELLHGVNAELAKLGRTDLPANADDVHRAYRRLPAYQLDEPLKAQAFHVAGRLANRGEPLLMRGGEPGPERAAGGSGPSGHSGTAPLNVEHAPARPEPRAVPPAESVPPLPAEPRPPLPPLPQDRRDAWARHLDQQAQRGGPSATNGKLGEGAPASRLGAWEHYAEKYNALQATLSSASPSASAEAAGNLVAARSHLAHWGMDNAAAVVADYWAARFDGRPHPAASDGRPAGHAHHDGQIPPRATPPRPLPYRTGDRLLPGGLDVVEKFHSGDEGLAHVQRIVLREAGAKVWERDRERIGALFSDDALQPKVPGLLRGGRAVTYVVDLGHGRTLSLGLRLTGGPESELRFKEDIAKYEFEHIANPASTVGNMADGRMAVTGGVQGSIAHAAAGDTAFLFGTREHQWALTDRRTDRQVSGGQTTEPSTRFHGCGCRLLRPSWSGRVRVLMEDAVESVTSMDVQPVELVWFGDRFGSWPRRNAAQVRRSRSGAGSIPYARRISHTVEGASLMPRAASSPWILL